MLLTRHVYHVQGRLSSPVCIQSTVLKSQEWVSLTDRHAMQINIMGGYLSAEYISTLNFNPCGVALTALAYRVLLADTRLLFVNHLLNTKIIAYTG